MATLRAAPTWHRHTELFSGIFTDQILNWPETKEGGRAGKKTLHKNGKQGRFQQIHFAKNCKHATANINHEVPQLMALGHPSIVEKTAGQHCFEANFA